MNRDDGISTNDLLFVLLLVFPFFAGTGLLAAKGNPVFLRLAFFVLLAHTVASLWLALAPRRPETIDLRGAEFAPYVVGAAWWFLLYGMTDGRSLTLSPLVISGLALNLFVSVALALTIPNDRRAFGAFILIPAAPLLGAIVGSINIHFDSAKPLPHRAPVILKFQGDPRRVVTLPISASQKDLFIAELPKAAEYRQIVEYKIHPGLLGLNWISGVTVTDEFSTMTDSELQGLANEAATRFGRHSDLVLEGVGVSFALMAVLIVELVIFAYLSGFCPKCRRRNFTLGVSCQHCSSCFSR